MKIYNKLVRDKIPQIIEDDGNKYDIRIADKKKESTFRAEPSNVIIRSGLVKSYIL